MPGMCFGMMKKANLPRYIAMSAVSGATSMAMTTIPGTLGAGNVVAAQILGTTVYAGASIGIVAGIVGIICLCIYLNRLINDARKKNIGYDPIGEGMMSGEVRSDEDMPCFAFSIIPVIFVIAFVAVLIFVFGLSSLLAAVFSLCGGIALNIILNFKYFKGVSNIRDCITSSVNGIQWNIVGALSVIGFATVIANTALFSSVVGFFMNSSMDPYLLIVFSVFVIAALCADCIGGTVAFLNTIGVKLANAGVNAAVVHRLANIASSTFDSMPHGGSMILALTMFGYDHKQAYKYLVRTNIIIPLIYTFAGLIAAYIFY
jgi:H+/gluconate symporter-like permease